MQKTLHVRTLGTELDARTRRWVEDRAARRLNKFAPRIQRVTFRFEDVNGPRGGRDRVCRGKVVLRGLPSAIAERRARTARAAFDQVSRQLARSVNEAVRDQSRLPRPTRAPLAAAPLSANATDRDAGLRNTAPRNRRVRPRRATAALENSATGKPSRKSTRGSANRAKSGSKLGRKVKRKLRSPQQRARRAQVKKS